MLHVFCTSYSCSENNVKNLITKANEMHYFLALFGKELYMFRTDLLSIIRSLNTVPTAIGIYHTSYVAVCQRGQDGTAVPS